MYECRYCASAFENVTETGACPACGAPKPKHLQPEVQTVRVNHYIYVESRNYYTPLEPTASQRAYSTLGYKVVSALTALTMIVLVVGFVYFWFFYQTSVPSDSDPALRNTLPTAVATVTPYHRDNPWEEVVKLTSSEAAALRDQANVIHLAYLTRGQSLYMNQSVVFNTDIWQKPQSVPLGIRGLTLNGTTGYEILINSDKYNLNIYQPFIMDIKPRVLYLIDENGQIWETDLDQITLVDLETAQNSLTVDIIPNPKLSSTY